MTEPLSAPEAKKLIRAILSGGDLLFRGHALDEMANDKLGVIGEVDVTNVLRGGVVQEGEWPNGSWRYQVRTQKITVVVAFQSETQLVAVTAWRNGP